VFITTKLPNRTHDPFWHIHFCPMFCPIQLKPEGGGTTGGYIMTGETEGITSGAGARGPTGIGIFALEGESVDMGTVVGF
jgi:hypothetical protein